MKIAVSGAHGVGKTTLAKSLAKKLNLPLVGEVARSVAQKQGYKNTGQIRDAERYDRYLFQQTVFITQLLEEEQRTSFVSDRSIFDPLAYFMYYDIDCEIFYIQASEWSKNYNLIINCPIPYDMEISNDGFRLTDCDSQKFVDIAIHQLLLHAECPVLWLKRDRDAWERESMEYIRKSMTNIVPCEEKLPADIESIAQLLKDDPRLLANVKTALERLDNDEMLNRGERE